MLATEVRTRFAPSPTGRLHLGNARAAFFNWCFARRTGGRFILRIEDTDAARSDAAHAAALMDDLSWLGLDWDEGPDREGPHAPYMQSQRSALYDAALTCLYASQAVYPCFCTHEALEAERVARRARGLPPRYAGTCASLAPEAVKARLDQGTPHTLRFRIPAIAGVVFDDLLRGPQRFSTRDLGDFVLRRADGSHAFLFTNAVDDALMGITHVLRGEDHLSNTPRQILLLQALDLPAPRYGHLALIVDGAGAPLAKRTGSVSLAGLRDDGYLPAALLNHLARLGHGETRSELLDSAALAQGFEIARLSLSAARHDTAQLAHWQRLAVTMADDDALWIWFDTQTRHCVPADARAAFIALMRDTALLPGEALHWARVLFTDNLPQDASAREVIAAAPPTLFAQAQAAFIESMGRYPQFIAELKASSGRGGQSLFLPLRAALTGQTHGPELARILELIPPPRIGRRLEEAERSAAHL
jgi:glutamyl-tRNA synthetase